jgi:chorismate lyase / 3-hydroxybenzoate synthase
MNAAAVPQLALLEVEYELAPLAELLSDPSVLAVIGFGHAAPPAQADPRYLRVGLEPAGAPAPFEVWRGNGDAVSGRRGALRYASDGEYLFGAIEVDETDHGGLAPAAEAAYRALAAFSASCSTPHILRIWNYFNSINFGADDEERYKQFCVGRALGSGETFAGGYPAATAIGSNDASAALQVYWLAARQMGIPVENPRQVSAYRYPRQYGPRPPNFARAMRSPTQPEQLYISGTAAVVGHESRHRGEVAAQVQEIVANLESLLVRAGIARPHHSAGLFKIYVRHCADIETVRQLLGERLPPGSQLLILQGDICRAELLVELDGLYGYR